MNLRHLNFKQTAEEFRACARNYHLRVVVGVLHFLDDGADGFALAVTVARNLLFLREDELVVLLVKNKHFAFPDLVDLAYYNLAFHCLELGIDGVFLKIEYLGCERLTECQDGAAAELLKHDFFRNVLADLAFRVNLAGGGKTDLHARILYSAVGHYREVLINLAVALVWVHDYDEILVRSKHLCQHVAERFLQHADHCGLVDILQLFKLRKAVYHAYGFLFLCHNVLKLDYVFCIFYFVITEAEVFLLLHRTLGAFGFHFLDHRKHEAVGVGTLEDAFELATVGSKHFNLVAFVLVILALYAQWRCQSG